MSRVIDALGYYEAKAQQMQRTSLRGDTKAMLALMQELAIDGGAIARRAIDSQTAPEPATVAVNREALEALRSAMSKLRAPMSRTEYAVARAGIIEAACRLLAGGE
jgi:hypothetical protein